jgi:hypothetical protein
VFAATSRCRTVETAVLLRNSEQIRPGAALTPFEILYFARLHGSHLSCRPNWQPQRLAQCGQVGFPWPAMIRFPKIDARLADADLIRDFGNRQTTLDPSITEIAGKINSASQFTGPYC